MIAGRPGHPAAPARLRSDSGRSRPRHRAVRPPTPALHRGPAAPRLLPTAHRHAGGRTPPDTRPRRHGRAAAGPGLIAPCPTPSPAPARTGHGRRQAAPRAPARLAPAAPGRSPLSATLTTRLLAVPTGLPPRSVAEPWAPGARLVGQLLNPYSSCHGLRLGTAASTHGTPPPPPGNAGVATRATLTSRGCGATRSGGDHKSDLQTAAWEGADR
jgi:hypothetical protein